MNKIEKFQFWACSIFSGLFWSFILTQEEVKLWSMIYCFVPLWWIWFKTKSYKFIFLSGWITQFVFSIFTFHWLKYTAFVFYGFEGINSWLFLIVFSSLSHIYLPLIGIIWNYLDRSLKLSKTTSLSMLVLLSSFSEFIVPQFFPFTMGQSWFFLDSSIAQLADITGFAGLSVLNYIIMAIILKSVWLLKNKNSFCLLKNVVIILIIIFTFTFLGHQRKLKWTKTDSQIKIHIYQSYIKPIEMLRLEMPEDQAIHLTLDHYFSRQSNFSETNEKPDLIIWSETAMPFNISELSSYVIRLKEYIIKQNIPLITGAYNYNHDHIKHNVVSFWQSDGKLYNYYNKHILMPFGEYLPLESYFPFLKTLAPQIPTYGNELKILTFNVGKASFSPSICYEALFSQHIRNQLNVKANILLNITSDVWFGPDKEPDQHNSLATSRAIEFRRPIVRVADSGISSIVLASGEKILKSPIWNEWQDTITLNYLNDPQNTFYYNWGYLYPYLLLFIILLITSYFFYIKNETHKPRPNVSHH